MRHLWRPAPVVLGLLLALVLVGPVVAPFAPGESAGVPFNGLSRDHVLGTDVLGRDVLSRVLHGGRSVIGLAVVATAAGWTTGVALGLVMGSSRSRTGPLLLWLTDLFLAFPGQLLLLLLVAAAG